MTHIFDRIFFTISFIVGVQAPAFMQQYIQRLAGHLDEAKFQLQQFQYIADLQFKGDLSLLINRYQTNADSAIVQTGDVVSHLVERINGFEQQLSFLQQNDYLTKSYHFVADIDLTMAGATLNDFQLAIPLELAPLATGAIFAFSLFLLQSLSVLIVKKTFQTIFTKKIKNS